MVVIGCEFQILQLVEMKMAGRRVWRDAATLMLTAKSPQGAQELANKTAFSAHFDYSVLMLKRSSRSKFMPNAYVFPGGVVSGADFSSSWKDHFKHHGHNQDDLEQLVLKDVDRPLLMTGDPSEGLARDISLRLTALRETFEESGILLHRSKEERGAFDFSDKQFLSDWRSRVHKEPDTFLELFQHLETVPDIWSLREWSDWLTPTDLGEQGNRRFDTMFYQASLTSVPSTLLDHGEVTMVQWSDPASILAQFYDRQIWLAPPQVYELSKLLNFPHITNLDRVSQERQGHGLSTWLPVRMQCQDGLLSLLPGDHLYPDNPDYVGPQPADQQQRYGDYLQTLNYIKIYYFSAHIKKTIQLNYNGTMEESRGKDLPLNRLEFRDMYDCVPNVTYKSKHKFPSSTNFNDFQV